MAYGESIAFPLVADSAAAAGVDERARFISRTYLHLFGAILAFVGLEWFLLNLSGIENLAVKMVSGYNWLIVLGAFILVSHVANRWAHSDTSVGVQYVGLGLYVVVEAVIFLPLLLIASVYYDGVIGSAAVLTLGVFTGLTGVVFVTRRNFSFLGPALSIGALVALGLIVCAVLIGFNLGIIFTAAMIALASGYILYSTSNILHEYRVDQHVAASLALFAAVALLFWYILQLVMSLTNRD